MRHFAVFVCMVELFWVRTSALTFQVEPRQEECFTEQIDNGGSVDLQWEVYRGGLLDVEIVITGPGERVLLQKLVYFNNNDPNVNEKNGNVNVRANTGGLHKICFSNKMAQWTAKVVSFEMASESARAKRQKAVAEVAKLEDLGSVVESISDIGDDLDKIERLQKHHRNRERNHRDVQELTNSRVAWMSIMECVILVSLSIFQLAYIRNWFTKAKSRGGV